MSDVTTEPVDLEAVRVLCDAATRGPWFADGSEIYSEFEGGPWVGETCHPDDPEKTAADSEFVAAARTLVPELVAEVERLRPVVEAAQAWRRMRDGMPTTPKPESAALIAAVEAYEAGGEVR